MIQFTLNFQNDSEPTGEIATSSLPVGSRSCASPSHKPENEKERRMTDTSGRKCLEQLERFDRVSLWVKMFMDSLIGMGEWYSTRCRLTWKMKGTKSRRLYFQLVPSTLHIDGIDAGLWPTPRAQEPGRTSEGYGASLMDIVKGYKKKTTASDTRLFRPEKSKEQTARIEQCDKGNVTDTGVFGWIQNHKQLESGESEYACSSWERFPTQSPVCSRNDGVSDQLDGITFPKWRVESIKAYGNAIVPQVAFQIFKAIVESTKNNH